MNVILSLNSNKVNQERIEAIDICLWRISCQLVFYRKVSDEPSANNILSNEFYDYSFFLGKFLANFRRISFRKWQTHFLEKSFWRTFGEYFFGTTKFFGKLVFFRKVSGELSANNYFY